MRTTRSCRNNAAAPARALSMVGYRSHAPGKPHAEPLRTLTTSLNIEFLYCRDEAGCDVRYSATHRSLNLRLAAHGRTAAGRAAILAVWGPFVCADVHTPTLSWAHYPAGGFSDPASVALGETIGMTFRYLELWTAMRLLTRILYSLRDNAWRSQAREARQRDTVKPGEGTVLSSRRKTDAKVYAAARKRETSRRLLRGMLGALS